MSKDYSPVLRPGADEEAIEPEIVGGPMPAGCGARKDKSLIGRIRSLILRIKLLFAAAIGLMALTLIILGAALTSTFFGAVLGIPLILAGGLLIWLLLKTLAFGRTRNFFVFTRKMRQFSGPGN